MKYNDADDADDDPGDDPGYDLSDDSGVGLRVLIILFLVERGDLFYLQEEGVEIFILCGRSRIICTHPCNCIDTLE